MALPRETNEDISLLLEGWWNNGGQMITIPCRPHTSWSEVKAKSLSLSLSIQHMEWFEEEKKSLPSDLFDPLPDLD